MGNDPSAAHAINSQVDLRRRHSERTHANSNPPYPEELPIAPQGQRRRRPNRPQTADTPSSPRAASAYFPHSIPLTSSPNELSSSPSERSEPSSVHGSSLRPRAQTNPPLLHRLSLNLFGSSTPSPSPVIPNAEPYNRSPSTSFSSSRPSLSRQSPKVSVEIPKPRYHEEEQPEIYVQRLMEAVSKAEVASVLAASADEFHTQALRSYLSQFDFNHDPLDVALRRLLMDVGLPRETQQIDRVMEAFAERYRHCHPNLFNSDATDHPYILAFSLIMLHTDAFNKSNKKKMSKADYLKNTRLPGLAPEVLDCFYDNIVFAPFIFIEDPLDVNGQRGLMSEGPRRLSTLGGSPGVHNNNSTTLLGKGNKIDPYYLITRNLLDDLRVEIRPYIPLTSPYFYQGTAGRWDENKLLRAFAMARVVEIASEHRYAAPPWFGLNVGAGPSAGAMMAVPTFSGGPYDMVHLKVTKVGSLLRKDDVLEGGRKGNSRKWKEWSVLLTGSQLLFSRDPQWAQNIQSRVNGKDNVMALNQLSMSRPDEMYSVRDAVAVFDRSYTKHPSTLRLVMPDGRHILLQARDELEMNEWISCINYASAFKTAGVRMRSLGLSGKDIELTGHAAAVSHLRDLNRPQPSPRVHSYSGHAVDSVPSPQSLDYSRSPSEATFDEPLTPPMENPSRLFKATFDQVKADLASGNEPISDAVSIRSGHRPRAYSLDSVIQRPLSPTLKPPEENVTPRLSSRSQIIKRKVHDLDSRIAVQKSQLDSDMRFVRNIAILTPFQRSTRDRLQSAIQNVSKRIMQVRLDVEKLVCHRDVLVQDLAAEERDWQRTKKIALRAATQKLEIERKRSVPRMTLSMYVDGEMTESSPSDALRTPNLEDGRPHSAAADSYHTAIEFMPDSAGPEPEAARADASLSLDLSTSMSLADLSISSSSPLIESPRPPLTSVRMSTESGTPGGTEEHSISHEQFYTASETLEEAEDWNKTRAAKRVSLVRVPSTLKLFSPKHGRDFSQVLSEDSGTTVTPDNLYRTRSTPYEPPLRTHSYSDSASLSHL
ncbi:hypothetical protein BDW22DRAFT_1320867 [Trametopsis cervina]|nr:hypothetical protein BDW22DRAFT_1320867 [Trametopsis cervina]